MLISSFFTGGLSAWSKGTMIPWWLGQWGGDLGKDFVVSRERNSMGLFSWRLVLSFWICCLNVFSRDRKNEEGFWVLMVIWAVPSAVKVGNKYPIDSFSFLLLYLSSALDWPTSLLVPGVRLKLGCMCLVCVLHCANPNSFWECFSNLSSSHLPLSASHSKSGVKGSWGPGSGWCWENLHAGRAKTGARQGKAGELRNALLGVCRLRSWDVLPKTLQKSKAFSALAWGPGCCCFGQAGGVTHSALKALFAGGSNWFQFCLFVLKRSGLWLIFHWNQQLKFLTFYPKRKHTHMC